jgi:hypothetical protein
LRDALRDFLRDLRDALRDALLDLREPLRPKEAGVSNLNDDAHDILFKEI